MTDEMDTFLATVDEFVDDEERIVTCKWLCQQIAVPLQQSQEILLKYIDSCEKQNKMLEVVHTLTGRLKNGLIISLVREKDLDVAKSKLDEVITSSLFSVQKGTLVDPSVLYTADYEATHNNYDELVKLGGIEYNGGKKLSKEEIRKFRMSHGVTKDVSSDIEKQFAKPQTSKKSNLNFFGKSSSSKATTSHSNPSTESSTAKASQPKKSPQGVTNILTVEKTNLFTKKQPTTKEIKLEMDDPKHETETSTSKLSLLPKNSEPVASKATNQKKSQLGVANFLTKQKIDPFAEKPAKGKESKQGDVKNVQTDVQQTMSKNNKSDPKSSSKTSSESTKQKLNGNHGKPEKSRKLADELKIDDFSDDEDLFKVEVKPKKKYNSKRTKKENPPKKRKRIECLSSSSEDESGEDEIVDVIPAPPPRKRIQDSPLKEVNKRMKKVLKTKTFIDEEGCMVTEKFFELEECNDAETVATGNNAQPGKSKLIESPTKVKFPSVSTAAQPKKQKQASIMGFFKKK